MKINRNLMFRQLPPYQLYYISHNYEDLYVWSAHYDPLKSSLIACCLLNKTSLGKLGRVWSLLETDILGSVILY